MKQAHVWAIVALMIAILLAYVLITLTKDAPSAPAMCVDEKTREEIRALTLDAIDTGFKAQVTHLFEIWLRDPAEQPKRAVVGMQSAISAYLRARQNAVIWDPPRC